MDPDDTGDVSRVRPVFRRPPGYDFPGDSPASPLCVDNEDDAPEESTRGEFRPEEQDLRCQGEAMWELVALNQVLDPNFCPSLGKLSRKERRELLKKMHKGMKRQREERESMEHTCALWKVTRQRQQRKLHLRLRRTPIVGDGSSQERPSEASREMAGTLRLLCPVCMDNDVDTVTDCGHPFCAECLGFWKHSGNSTCPNCRKGGFTTGSLYI